MQDGRSNLLYSRNQTVEGGDDCMMLLTSQVSKEVVIKLQRKLYQKAKHQPTFQFYALYDKVYRSDVLQHAYNLVKQNRGSPGIDGETFEVKGQQSGKHFLLVEPSDKAMKSIKQKIKHYTRRDMNPVPINEIVKKINAAVRGWSNYFHYGHGHRKLKKVKYYVEESLRLHLRYRHKLSNRGAAYQRFPRKYIYNYLKLYLVPTTPMWKGVHAWGEEYRKAVCGKTACPV